jgi:hypothetical protein
MLHSGAQMLFWSQFEAAATSAPASQRLVALCSAISHFRQTALAMPHPPHPPRAGTP